MNTENAIVEKIRKLLAIANNNSNINEAANAAGKAKEIALKYNIALELLNHPKDEEIINFIVEYGIPFLKSDLEPWELLLSDIVAAHCGCRVLSLEQNGNIVMTIIGKQEDINISKTLIEWLRNQIIMISLYETNENKMWLHAFKLGAIRKINQKLEEIDKKVSLEFRDNDKIRNALSIIQNRCQKVDEFITRTVQKEQGLDLEIDHQLFVSAYHKGFSAGDKISLNKKLENVKNV